MTVRTRSAGEAGERERRRRGRTLTDSEPALIFPQETASSGRAPESEPSNSWPVFCAAGWVSEVGEEEAGDVRCRRRSLRRCASDDESN